MHSEGFLRGARKPGLGALVIGLVLVVINVKMILESGTYYPKALMVGVIALPVGLAMVACPGTVTLPLFTAEPVSQSELFAGLSLFERTVWIAATLVGLTAGLYVIFAL